jgi:acyl-coenzyme A synthetase/AMP-(fatty) acid ligase
MTNKTKPLLILRSPLSLRYYATRAYKVIDEEKGHIEVTGRKDDVTEQIEEIVKMRIKENEK